MAKRILEHHLTPSDAVDAYKASAAADQSHLGRRTANRLKEVLKARGVRGDACIQDYKRFMVDRVAARLGQHRAASRIMAKGGIMWFLDDMASARPTADLDLHAHKAIPHEEVLQILREALLLDLGDGCFFSIDRIDSLDHTTLEEVGLRTFIEGYAGGTHTGIHVDWGFGGKKPVGAVERTWTPMVKGIVPTTLLTQPWSYVVTDKVSALLQHGMKNSRMKDYRDLWVLSRRGMDLAEIGAAFADVLPGRGFAIPKGTEPGLSVEFAETWQPDWAGYLDRAGLLGQVPNDFFEVVCDIRAFVADIHDVTPEVAPAPRFAA